MVSQARLARGTAPPDLRGQCGGESGVVVLGDEPEAVALGPADHWGLLVRDPSAEAGSPGYSRRWPSSRSCFLSSSSESKPSGSLASSMIIWGMPLFTG